MNNIIYIVGLIVPDAEWALEWARSQDEKFDMPALQDLPAFRSAAQVSTPDMPRMRTSISQTSTPPR